MDGKSQAWRDAADRLLEALARDNQYIVGDILIIFLESAGYGLSDYTPLGGVFKRAAKKGIVSRIQSNRKQALWKSEIYGKGKIDISMMNKPEPEIRFIPIDRGGTRV